MTRTVHLCAAPNGTVILDRPGSTRPTHIAVSDVPVTLRADVVARQVNKLVLWPWPAAPISWPAIDGLSQGRLYPGKVGELYR